LQAGLHRGHLLQPLAHLAVHGRIHASCIYSNDHGASWHGGASTGPGTDESKTVQLADGTVLQNARSDQPQPRMRVVTLSHDGGAHFDEPRPEPQLPDPHVNGDIIRVAPLPPTDQADAHRLLFNNPVDPAQRRKLAVRLSCDDGEHWSTAACSMSAP
jgi:Neuraminidase (sialidase)